MFYSANTFDLDTGVWSKTDFATRKSALGFVQKHIKYPGEYNLKYTQGVWNEHAVFFQQAEANTGNGHYPIFREGSLDFRKHWDFEKEKCLFEGFIIYKKPSEDIEFVVPCLYYWYLNYCPIPDKVKQREDFPEIYDGDLHYFLYILECILSRLFGVVLKKRQSGYTLKNDSIVLNAIWFGKSAMAKIFAFDESKVLEAWSFMTRYRDHINEHCGWKRGFDPGIALKWHIRRKQTDGSFKGNNSQAKGFTTKQDPTNGVGGSAKVIFGEESGINPTLDKTHEFITSNVSYGGLTTGLILYSGAVGELDKAEPLKQYILHPEDNGFLSRPNNILEDVEFGDRVGFFAPEWWNYMSVERDEDDKPIGEGIRCFDEWGNSNKEFALREIEKWREREKKKSPEKYRYYCSQRPLSIKEAFAWRRESKFPQNLVQAQKRRIEDKTYPTEYVDIRQTPKGLEFIKTSALPISEFPLGRAVANKEGCIVIYERPIGTPELGKQYVASIDPVKEGKTSTSYSLFSIVIYKLDVEVIKYGEEVESWIEPGQIVAEWCGRFDDINKTHERAAFMLEMYQARAIVEANVSEFVNYMIGKRRQHYLVPKTQMLFLKELGANETSYQEYGWKNTGKIFENHLLRYAIEFLSEELSSETHANGSVVIKKYGIERIPSIMILKEMEAYQPGMNVDRLISFAALTAYIKIYLANVGYARREEAVEHKKPADKNLYAVPRSFFKNVGTVTSTDEKYQIKRSPFKNIK